MTNLEKLSDSELISKIGECDEKAFDIFYTRYKEYIGTYFLKKIKDYMVAEDLAMETFENVWRSAKTFRNENAKVKTWLFKIAENKYKDHLKKYNRHSLLLDNIGENNSFEDISFFENIEDSGNSPEEEMIFSERNRFLKDAVNNINSKQISYSQIIRLRYFEGLSYKELAEKLGVKKSTIKSQIFRAHQLLKKEFNSKRCFLPYL